MSDLRAPFPWFGAKSRVAETIWRAFGPDVPNFVDPFCGSLAALLLRPGGAGKIETVNDDSAALCLAPETRILTSDLRWVRAGAVRVGDELIGFDENNGEAREGLRAPKRYRRWQRTTVLDVRMTVKPCYKLTFDDGTVVVASADHLWLGGSHRVGGRGWRWQRTEGLVCNRATQRSWLLKLAPVVEREETYEAGWIGGFFDGEGNVKPGSGWQLSVCQKLGPEADRVERLLRERGFDVHRIDVERAKENWSQIMRLSINGGMREALRFLMQTRPERLISNIVAQLHGKSLYAREHQAVGLVRKEYVGEIETVAISTTTRTFVAEGLASHNCNFWRAITSDPDGVAHHCDWPVNEIDLHARHKWLVRELAALKPRLERDPELFDAKIAGWWVWGICCWIGGGWCEEPENGKRPDLLSAGRGILKRKRPGVAAGVHVEANWDEHTRLPDIGNNRGIFGVAAPPCQKWFRALSERLRRVRVCCGDWTRVLGPGTLGKGKNVGGRRPCAVLLDPPYPHDHRDPNLYGGQDSPDVWWAARDWALEHGDDPDLRIALCGYAGDFGEYPGWTEYAWRGARGYAGKDNENRDAERIWFSKGCLPLVRSQQELFDSSSMVPGERATDSAISADKVQEQ